MSEDEKMGDHRISIKATFEMHGHKDEIDWWLNWSDDIPQNLADWVEQQKLKAMNKFWDEDEQYQAQLSREKAEHQEQAERAEYERLKAKFDPPPGSPR